MLYLTCFCVDPNRNINSPRYTPGILFVDLTGARETGNSSPTCMFWTKIVLPSGSIDLGYLVSGTENCYRYGSEERFFVKKLRDSNAAFRVPE